MSKNPSKDIGNMGEDQAVQYLQGLGCQILARNFHSAQGELDIVAKDKDFIVFVEVKNYSYKSFGFPLGAVRQHKKQSLIHAARTYLWKNNIKNINCRFDVIAIYRSRFGTQKIEHVRNAFFIN